MLVFVNYTHSGKKKLEIMLLLFTLSLVKKKKTRGKLLCNRQINCKYIYPIYN